MTKNDKNIFLQNYKNLYCFTKLTVAPHPDELDPKCWRFGHQIHRCVIFIKAIKSKYNLFVGKNDFKMGLNNQKEKKQNIL